MTAPKPKRRTRERVLATSLALFNNFGEPNVTTTTIAEEMNISPGNLYYHFRNKDDIVNDIYAVFERELRPILSVPADRDVTIEDAWLFLHVLFETIWKYRFFYRDLADMLSRNRNLELRFKQILTAKVDTARALCEGLVRAGAMRTDASIDGLATNMMLVATYWLSFAFVRDPRHFEGTQVIADGAQQVMTLLEPHLAGDARQLFARLAAEYRTGRPGQPG